MYQVRWTGKSLAVAIADSRASLAVVRYQEAGITRAVTRHLENGGFFEIACSAAPSQVFVDLMHGGRILAYDSLYVYRPLLNGQDVLDHYRRQGFGPCLLSNDMHVTCCYSKEKMFWSVPADESWHQVPPGANRMTEIFGTAVVLRFDCGYLDLRNQAFRAAGASSDYPTYKPHVTITYELPPLNMATVMPYVGELVFGPEQFEPINGPYIPVLKAKWGVWLADRRNPTVVEAGDEKTAREAVRKKYGGKYGQISKLKMLQGKDAKLAEQGKWERDDADE